MCFINNAGLMPFDDSVRRDGRRSRCRRSSSRTSSAPSAWTSALIDVLKAQPSSTVIQQHVGRVVDAPGHQLRVFGRQGRTSSVHPRPAQASPSRGTSVEVIEIAPPWVNTDHLQQSGDPRAMPLDDYVNDTMRQLGTDEQEIIVDAIRDSLRDNPGTWGVCSSPSSTSTAEHPIPVESQPSLTEGVVA